MHWTKDFPKKEGWYWFRDSAFPLSGFQRVIHVEKEYLALPRATVGMSCEWSGPIPEPEGGDA